MAADHDTQNARVLAHLRRYGAIGLVDALRFEPPITRLAARVANLQAQGYDIRNTAPGNRPARYVLTETVQLTLDAAS